MAKLCFILMPFGIKTDAAGKKINFDLVYQRIIEPAVLKVGMEPLRADKEVMGGIIHVAMFERLILCDFAVADLTTANANVFYELGVRHGVRPGSTVCMFAEGTNLPFDVKYLRCVPYTLSKKGVPENPDPAIEGLCTMLKASIDGVKDSPVFSLVEGLNPQKLDHQKTDSFRKQADYDNGFQNLFAAARALPRDDAENELARIQATLKDIKLESAGVIVDLYLSYRAIEAWQRMLDLHDQMDAPLQRSVMVQEQRAFALNRLKRGGEAEKVLKALIATNGPSSETYGLLGRVYKDRFRAERKKNPLLAKGHLAQAIEAYASGFEADMRDAYPAINAVTLMEVAEPPDPRRLDILPVVRFAVTQKIAAGEPDYWDHATLLELAVLRNDQKASGEHLAAALAVQRDVWESRTTAENLEMIADARGGRQQDVTWILDIITALRDRADQIHKQGK